MLAALVVATPFVLKVLQFSRPSASVSLLPACAALLALAVFVCVTKKPELSKWSWKQAFGFGAAAVVYAVLFAQIRFGAAALGLIAPAQYAFFTGVMYVLTLVFLGLAVLQIKTCTRYTRTLGFSAVLGCAGIIIGTVLLAVEPFVRRVYLEVLVRVLSASVVHVPNVGDLLSVGAVTLDVPSVMPLVVLACVVTLLLVLLRHRKLSPAKTVGALFCIPLLWMFVQGCYEYGVLLLAKNSALAVGLLLDPLVLWVLLALYLGLGARLVR